MDSSFSPRSRIALSLAGLLAVQVCAVDAAAVPAGRTMIGASTSAASQPRERARVSVKAAHRNGAGLELTVGMTLNGDGSSCGSATALTVNVGDTIDFCYTVTNLSTTALRFSTLDDSVDGNLFTNMPTDIAAGGGSYVHHRRVTATADATHEAVWTARDLLPGYTWEDTQPAAFVDIRATGQPLGVDDDGEAGVTMPFAFPFYDGSSDQLCVGNNGGIIFGTETCEVAFLNRGLPSDALPGAAILPFWDDFYGEGGGVYWLAEGTSPNRRVIVQWDRPHYDDPHPTPSNADFEVILGEDGSLSFEYLSTDFGDPIFDHAANATIGLQNADGSIANQYSFNTVLAHPAPSSIHWTSGTAVVLTATAEVSIDAGAPVVEVTPGSISETVPSGSSTPLTTTLEIANHGDRDLSWAIAEAPADRAPTARAAGARPAAVVATGSERKRLYAERKRAAIQGHPEVTDYRSLAPLPQPAAAATSPSGAACGDSVSGMVVHDDGTVDNGYTGNPDTDATFTSVDKFTPSFYPATFSRVCIEFVTFPGGPTSVDFEVVAYDDDGPDGSPGTELGAVAVVGGAVAQGVDTVVFNDVDISALGLNVVEGSVYIGARYVLPPIIPIFLAADESKTTPSAGGYTGADRGAGTVFVPTSDMFEAYKSLFVRAVEAPLGCVAPTDVPWMSLDVTSGTVEVGGAPDTSTLTLDPGGLVDGLYTANVCVTSNDRARRLVSVPVEFTVGTVTPIAAGSPASLDFELESGSTGTRTLSIRNDGSPGSRVTFTITEAQTDCAQPSDVTWLDASPATGSVKIDTPVAVQVAVDTTSLPVGPQSARICVATNDPAHAVISVPVSLVVDPVDAIFADDFEFPVPAVYADRSRFLQAIHPGYFENDFSDVPDSTEATPALSFSDAASGFSYVVDSLPDRDELWNRGGVISARSSRGKVAVTFTGAPVTAVGGDFYARDGQWMPFVGNEVIVTLSDGTVETFTVVSSEDFRGFTTASPITSITVDSPNPSDPGDGSWATLDNLIVGSTH